MPGPLFFLMAEELLFFISFDLKRFRAQHLLGLALFGFKT